MAKEYQIRDHTNSKVLKHAMQTIDDRGRKQGDYRTFLPPVLVRLEGYIQIGIIVGHIHHRR